MPTLTPKQQQFLDKWVRMRTAENKGQLGGRQLAKIKDQYADFCRRRAKCESALEELASGFGAAAAESLKKALASVVSRIDNAADAGDDSIFKTAYDDLESIKADIRRASAARLAEEKDTAEASAKFTSAIEKLQRQASPDKRKALAQQLGATCEAWLGKHPAAVAPDVTNAYLQAIEIAGKAERKELNRVGEALMNQVYALCQEVKPALDDKTFDADDKARRYSVRMSDLEDQLQKALTAAQKDGHVLAAAQIERALDSLHDVQWRAHPPKLPVLIGTDTDSTESDSESSATSSDADENPVQLLTAPVTKLSNHQMAKRALLKVGGVLDHFKDEIDRVTANLKEIDLAVQQFKRDHDAKKSVLAEDFRLLGDAVMDATEALSQARDFLAHGRQQQSLGDKNRRSKGKWEDALELAVMASDMGLAQLAICEKSLGAAEGGLEYVERSARSLDTIGTRIQNMDESLITAIETNLGLLADCDNSWAKGDELDMLKHLVFTGSDPVKARALVQSATDRPSLDKAVQKLLLLPKLGTSAMTGLLSQCHQLVIDAERLYGNRTAADKALAGDAIKAKFKRIAAIAQTDAARFTVPVIPRPANSDPSTALQSVGVAVVGGGPIGLLAAVEARMAGASQVHVYEGRNDAYSRLNVLKIDEGPAQRLKAAGVSELVFPDGYDKDQQKKHIASVRTIENALYDRCRALGVSLERDRFLVDVTRPDGKRTHLFFNGDPVPKLCDVLIVATGGSVASAQKHANNVVLSDQLGIPFQKSEVKDYAAVGVFGKNAPPSASKSGATEGWAYDFETREVKYLVTQLTEEEFKRYGEEPRLLMEKLQKDAETKKMVAKQSMKPQSTDPARDVVSLTDDKLDKALDAAWDKLVDDLGGVTNFYGTDRAKDDERVAASKASAKKALQLAMAEDAKKKKDASKGDGAKQQPPTVSPAAVEKALLKFLMMEMGGSRFPIEVQQARGFASTSKGAVLVGDSAATPHPSASKGLNTGINEMGAVRDLIQDLQQGTGTDEDRGKAMQMYEFEVKRRTDFLIAETFEQLQSVTRARVTKLWENQCTPAIRTWVPFETTRKWMDSAKNRMGDLSFDRKDNDKDRDWKQREQCVKSLRAFEQSLMKARDDVLQLVAAGTTDAKALMQPFDRLVA